MNGDEFDLAQVIGLDDATAQEKMNAYRDALRSKRAYGMLAALSGDKALGAVGSGLSHDASVGEAMLSKVPEAQAQYEARKQSAALHGEQMKRIAAQNAARVNPETARVLVQTLKGYGVNVPEGTPVETMEGLLPHARESWQTGETVKARTEVAAQARADRQARDAETRDAREARAALAAQAAEDRAGAAAEKRAGELFIGADFTPTKVPIPQSVRAKFIDGTAATRDVLASGAELDRILAEGAGLPVGPRQNEIERITSGMMIRLNEIAQLGALSVGDRQILERMLGDPTSYKARVIGNPRPKVQKAMEFLRKSILGKAKSMGADPIEGSFLTKPFVPAGEALPAAPPAAPAASPAPAGGLPRAAGREVPPTAPAPAAGPAAAVPQKGANDYLEAARARRGG